MTEEERIKATRRARAIASDIKIYNEQKIIKGLENDNLFEVLREALDEGVETYRKGVSAEIAQTQNFFERAVCDVIVKPFGHVKTRVW